jgi:membrane fusion protein (multidrug efflux system)
MKTSVPVIAAVALAAAGLVGYFGHRWIAQGPTPVVNAADAKASSAGGDKSAGKTADASKGAAASPAKGAPGPTVVEAMVVQPTAVLEELQAVGSLRSNESVLLRPEVAGRIAAIGFRDGQWVKRGQVLVALDASLNEAEVAKARAELNLAQSNLKRTEDLASKQFVSGSAQDTATSNVQVLEANLKLAQARLAKMRIVAPFDGVVGIRNVSVGDFVRDGADLVNIEDIGTLKVDFRLPERDFTRVKVGQPVLVAADALPGENWRGTLEAINPRVDANGRSLELRARLANSGGRLKPGMFVRVRAVVGERPSAILVPEEAIVPAGEEFYVFKVVDGVARRIKVALGVRRDAKVEIVEGLAPGDLVVTLGMRLFRDGQPVRVVQAGAAGKVDGKGDGKSEGKAP